MLQTLTNGGALTTTTSFQDIPNLTFTVSAGGTYVFRAYYIYTGSTTAAQMQPTMGGTCTATLVDYRCSIQTNSSSGGSSSQVHSILSNTGTGATAVTTASANCGVVIDGLIVVSAAGTLTVQAKHVGAACNVLSGGRYLLEQVA
ncbi:hypothetical protein GCM10023196_035710 [Actinoallomurus vinaceus]|uniref:Uncharacterized protein n=1 Tax=Actinoallomurus vinaceus TaxID=1080074 RepID=A0ABP8U941_9ACTN